MRLYTTKTRADALHYGDGKKTVCGRSIAGEAEAYGPTCGNCIRVASMRARRQTQPAVKAKPVTEAPPVNPLAGRVAELEAENVALRVKVARLEEEVGTDIGKTNALLRRLNAQHTATIREYEKAGGGKGLADLLKTEREKSARLTATVQELRTGRGR